MASSSKFASLFKGIVTLILLGCLAFSIVRNIRGLESGYPGVSFEWQLLIALTVTLASFALTGSSILTSFHAGRQLRFGLFCAGLLFSFVSFWLSFGGAVEDNKAKYHVNAIRDPQVVSLEQEIQEIVDRQSEYGITDYSKRSLLAREKELRRELQDVRAQVRAFAENQRRKAERNAGKLDALALVMFCALPEVGLITFTMLLVLLSGVSIFSEARPEFQLPQYQPPAGYAPLPQQALPAVQVPVAPPLVPQSQPVAAAPVQTTVPAVSQEASKTEVVEPQAQALEVSRNGKAEAVEVESAVKSGKWDPFG